MTDDHQLGSEDDDYAELRGGMRLLREQAEAQALIKIAQSAKRIATLDPDQVRGLMHELSVHEIELEMQNEELRLIQAELEGALGRYFELYDLAPVGYCSLSETGRVLQANQLLATWLGTSEQALVTRPLASFIHPDEHDNEYLLRRRLLNRGSPQMCQWRFLSHAGNPIWVQVQAVLRADAKGAPSFHLVLTNIDELKQTQQALQATLNEQNARIQALQQQLSNCS
ncbi:MAG: PAS domain-containing protein [Pseudomonas sp.]|uniref:PAS domain-containing protein n=1 Tax=Pseudomonas sp. TaxID=306 RepID=UPI002736F785|nr:PAS domain-containing protein [Pseudomonas sp.]MDP3847030.1 PAS domain-containing protein [Pseudomonas sp.]